MDKKLPMLNEREWEEISPLLTNTVEKIKEYHEKHSCDIATARVNCNPEAVAKFEELTGHKNIRYEVIFYLRRSSYGPKCEGCGKLYRTPKAKLCADCGQELEQDA